MMFTHREVINKFFYNFSVAATFSLVSGELVVADVSELYNNGIIGEWHTPIYTRQYNTDRISSHPLLAGTVAGSIQAGKCKDPLHPRLIYSMVNMTKPHTTYRIGGYILLICTVLLLLKQLMN
jgi:hypothetical protein